MKLVFYTPSYPTFSDVGHFGRFLTDGFLATCLSLNLDYLKIPGTHFRQFKSQLIDVVVFPLSDLNA